MFGRKARQIRYLQQQLDGALLLNRLHAAAATIMSKAYTAETGVVWPATPKNASPKEDA